MYTAKQGTSQDRNILPLANLSSARIGRYDGTVLGKHKRVAPRGLLNKQAWKGIRHDNGSKAQVLPTTPDVEVIRQYGPRDRLMLCSVPRALLGSLTREMLEFFLLGCYVLFLEWLLASAGCLLTGKGARAIPNPGNRG